MTSITSQVARLLIGGNLIVPSIFAFSSEYNSGGVQRLVANLVNGVGMSGPGNYYDTHGNIEEQVWHHGPGDTSPWVARLARNPASGAARDRGLERKPASSVRTRLVELLGLGGYPELDALDLRVESTLDGAAQRRATEALRGLRDPRRAAASGLTGFRLLRPGEGTAVVVDHAARTWREAGSAAGAQVAVPPGSLRALAVTATGESRTIGGFSCRKYLADSATQLGNDAPPQRREWEIWASEEAGASPGARPLAALLGIPLIRDSPALAEELGRIRGLPVRQVERTTILGRSEERTTTLRSVETLTVPPETWETPAGYTRVGP